MLVCSQDMVPGGLWRTDRAKLAGNCVSTLLHSHSFTPIYSLSLLKKAFSSSGVPAVIKENHVHVCLCVCVCVGLFTYSLSPISTPSTRWEEQISRYRAAALYTAHQICAPHFQIKKYRGCLDISGYREVWKLQGESGTLNRTYLPWLGNTCNLMRIQHIVSGEGFWQTGRGCNDVGQRGTSKDQKRERERVCHKTLEERKSKGSLLEGFHFSLFMYSQHVMFVVDIVGT